MLSIQSVIMEIIKAQGSFDEFLNLERAQFVMELSSGEGRLRIRREGQEINIIFEPKEGLILELKFKFQKYNESWNPIAYIEGTETTWVLIRDHMGIAWSCKGWLGFKDVSKELANKLGNAKFLNTQVDDIKETQKLKNEVGVQLAFAW